MTCFSITAQFYFGGVACRQNEIQYATLKEVTSPRILDQVYSQYDMPTHHALCVEGICNKYNTHCAITFIRIVCLFRAVTGGFDAIGMCFVAGFLYHNDISHIHKHRVRFLKMSSDLAADPFDWFYWTFFIWCSFSHLAMIGLAEECSSCLKKTGMSAMAATKSSEVMQMIAGQQSWQYGEAECIPAWGLVAFICVTCVTNQSEDVSIMTDMLAEFGTANEAEKYAKAGIVNKASTTAFVWSSLVLIARAQLYVGNASESRQIAQIALNHSHLPRQKSEAHRLLGVLDARESRWQSAEAELMQAMELAREEELALFEVFAAAELRSVLEEQNQGDKGRLLLDCATAKLSATPVELALLLREPRCWAFR